jgi:hypothetical protein
MRANIVVSEPPSQSISAIGWYLTRCLLCYTPNELLDLGFQEPCLTASLNGYTEILCTRD